MNEKQYKTSHCLGQTCAAKKTRNVFYDNHNGGFGHFLSIVPNSLLASVIEGSILLCTWNCWVRGLNI
ncbi:hypothetical protein Lal_00020763 [Lupinus albus]|nr:hypothetical protein Lal_00020763 [Lupinus albus]